MNNLFRTIGVFLLIGIQVSVLPAYAVEVEGGTKKIDSSQPILAQYIKGEELISPYSLSGEALVKLIRKMCNFNGIPGSNIMFNRRTGQLFVKQTPSEHANIERILNELRRVNYRQIEIEARIIKVSSTDIDDIGLDFLGLDLKRISDNHGIATDSVFGGDDTYTTNIDFPQIVDSGSNQIGNQISFAVLGKNIDMDAYIDALKSHAVVNTLSAPKIIVANNQRANIKIEKAQHYIRMIDVSVNGSAVALDPEVSIARSGTILDVIPTINADNTISLELHPVFATVDISDVETIKVNSSLADSKSPQVTLPVYSIQHADTTLTVENGGVAVIGGVIEEKETKVDYKVPLLGDIPVVGKYVFSNSQVQEEKSHLVIFVKAKVIDSRKSYIE